MAIFEAYLLVLYALSTYACFSTRTSPVVKSVLVLLALYFLILSGGSQAVGRYRAPRHARVVHPRRRRNRLLKSPKKMRGHQGPACHMSNVELEAEVSLKKDTPGR